MLKKILSNILYIVIVTGVILLIWALAAKKIGFSFILPTPRQTFNELAETLKQKWFYIAYLGTLLRTFISFAISIFAALVCAIITKQFMFARRLISPFISIMRSLPTMAIVLLLVIWTNSKIAPIIVSLLVVFPTLYTQFIGDLDGIDVRILQMAKVYKVPQKRIISQFYIPQLLPVFVLAAGAALSLNIKLMVAAEVLAQTTNSIGGHMQLAGKYYQTGQLMALTVITVVTGIVIEWASKLFSPLWRWKR